MSGYFFSKHLAVELVLSYLIDMRKLRVGAWLKVDMHVEVKLTILTYRKHSTPENNLECNFEVP